VDYGIRRIVDLRLASELEEDAPREVPVEVVHIPFFEDVSLDKQIEIAQLWLSAPDDIAATRDGYLEMLDTYRANVAAAISAVAQAPEGGVLIHCMGGKDRTGLVAALLLRVAGVPIADIAADYGLSAENIKPLWQQWVEDAGDESERELRRRLSASPTEAMAQVLETLERQHGSVRQYLLDVGVSEADLDRAVVRLRGAD
jgi:transposase-like protein